jgi:hypothetical protein
MGDTLHLSITKTYVLTDDNNKEHNVLSAHSVYQVSCNEIKNREDVSAFYNDATKGLNEAYQYVRKQLPALFNITFPNLPIEQYKHEIDHVFQLLNSRN